MPYKLNMANIGDCMKQKENKNLKAGFTLLELLVVVLIIGILAAIALPRYQLAVDKADFLKYQSMVSSLRDAYNEYVLIHGQGTKEFKDLSFTLPEDFSQSANNSIIQCFSDNTMFCCMSDFGHGTPTNAIVNCGKKDLSVIYSEILFGPDGADVNKEGKCVALPDSTRANRLCSSIGEYVETSNSRTPENNWNNTYNFYRLK